jgi:hypothetical protein
MVDAYVMTWVFVASAALVAAIVLAQGAVTQRAVARGEFATDSAVRDWAIAAIAAAGGADRVIQAALADAGDSIAQGRRSRDGTDPVLDLQVAVAARALAAYARTGDDALDVVRALALAREASGLPAGMPACAETFGEWLTRDGGRFLR